MLATGLQKRIKIFFSISDNYWPSIYQINISFNISRFDLSPFAIRGPFSCSATKSTSDNTYISSAAVCDISYL